MDEQEGLVSPASNESDSLAALANITDIFGPQRDELYIVVPITVIYILIFITGLVGNIFTCFVIVRNRSMHTATNYYLFSLACSDLLLLISGIPQEIYSIWVKWPYAFGESFCWLRGLASETSTNASVLTITLFTVERYLAICHPFLSHRMSNLSRALRHMCIVWVVSFFLALPTALQLGIIYYKGIAMCLQTHVILEHSFEISTFVFFLAPMILITVLYCLIGLRLKQASSDKDLREQSMYESCHGNMSTTTRRTPYAATRRMVKMLVAVVVAFFVCWAPFHAQRLVAIYGTGENNQAKSQLVLQIYSFLTYISGVFYYMSTCINPIFYHLMSNKFRDAFKVTVSQICCYGGHKVNDPKRYSYTAIALARMPSSSTTPPNSGSIQRQVNNITKKRKYLDETNGDVRISGDRSLLPRLLEENVDVSQSKRRRSATMIEFHNKFRVDNEFTPKKRFSSSIEISAWVQNNNKQI